MNVEMQRELQLKRYAHTARADNPQVVQLTNGRFSTLPQQNSVNTTEINQIPDHLKTLLDLRSQLVSIHLQRTGHRKLDYIHGYSGTDTRPDVLLVNPSEATQRLAAQGIDTNLIRTPEEPCDTQKLACEGTPITCRSDRRLQYTTDGSKKNPQLAEQASAAIEGIAGAPVPPQEQNGRRTNIYSYRSDTRFRSPY